jgi:hypothetical protein
MGSAVVGIIQHWQNGGKRAAENNSNACTNGRILQTTQRTDKECLLWRHSQITSSVSTMLGITQEIAWTSARQQHWWNETQAAASNTSVACIRSRGVQTPQGTDNEECLTRRYSPVTSSECTMLGHTQAQEVIWTVITQQHWWNGARATAAANNRNACINNWLAQTTRCAGEECLMRRHYPATLSTTGSSVLGATQKIVDTVKNQQHWWPADGRGHKSGTHGTWTSHWV